MGEASITTAAFSICLRHAGTSCLPATFLRRALTERWQALAAEARATAREMTDPDARRALLFIAAAYDRLARGALKRQKA
jgi:hypothetical protein